MSDAGWQSKQSGDTPIDLRYKKWQCFYHLLSGYGARIISKQTLSNVYIVSEALCDAYTGLHLNMH